MATRTNVVAVAGVLGNNWDGTTGLQPFIDAATTIVDDVSNNDAITDKVMTTTKLELVERWLAAHFYHCADPTYQSKSTGKASGQFQGQSEMNFAGSRYGQMAIRLDTSRYLAALDQKGIVGGFWGGLPPSQQTDYVDRD